MIIAEKTPDPELPHIIGRDTGAEAKGDVTSSSSKWNFEAFRAEQRRNQEDHEVRRERVFQRVLSSLGGPVEDAPTLPSDMLRRARNRNLATTELEANEAKKQQQIKENHELSLQRERLRQRYVPGGEDSVGEDPLTLCGEQSTPVLPCPDILTPASGPVRLELGIDAALLDKILAEIEEESAMVVGDPRENNSELSRVLDILDDAVGDTPAVDIVSQSLRMSEASE